MPGTDAGCVYYQAQLCTEPAAISYGPAQVLRDPVRTWCVVLPYPVPTWRMVLRFDQDFTPLVKALPPKFEFTLQIRLSELQVTAHTRSYRRIPNGYTRMRASTDTLRASPVRSLPNVLRFRYAFSGTDIRYRPMPKLCGAGTDGAYAAKHRRVHMVLTAAMQRCTHCADGGYAAMHIPY
eukprot:390889-Rhodomonas_salina.3